MINLSCFTWKRNSVVRQINILLCLFNILGVRARNLDPIIRKQCSRTIKNKTYPTLATSWESPSYLSTIQRWVTTCLLSITIRASFKPVLRASRTLVPERRWLLKKLEIPWVYIWFGIHFLLPLSCDLCLIYDYLCLFFFFWGGGGIPVYISSIIYNTLSILYNLLKT